jgi:hypothetical protein
VTDRERAALIEAAEALDGDSWHLEERLADLNHPGGFTAAEVVATLRRLAKASA